jgi:hypothetical protein
LRRVEPVAIGSEVEAEDAGAATGGLEDFDGFPSSCWAGLVSDPSFVVSPEEGAFLALWQPERTKDAKKTDTNTAPKKVRCVALITSFSFSNSLSFQV